MYFGSWMKNKRLYVSLHTRAFTIIIYGYEEELTVVFLVLKYEDDIMVSKYAASLPRHSTDPFIVAGSHLAR